MQCHCRGKNCEGGEQNIKAAPEVCTLTMDLDGMIALAF